MNFNQKIYKWDFDDPVCNDCNDQGGDSISSAFECAAEDDLCADERLQEGHYNEYNFTFCNDGGIFAEKSHNILSREDFNPGKEG